MKKRIIISSEVQKEIAQVMGVTDRWVRSALAYDTHTDVARRVRAMAIEKGGEVVGGEKLETSYPVGRMVQTYGGRLRIETDLRNALTIVYVDGEEQERQKGLSVDHYTRLQERYIRKVDVQ